MKKIVQAHIKVGHTVEDLTMYMEATCHDHGKNFWDHMTKEEIIEDMENYYINQSEDSNE